MKKTCYIVGAGDNSGTNFLKKENDYVIAADGGLKTLQDMNIVPDMIMGDFDSLGYVPDGENVIRHEVMKDDTDMMLAVKFAMDKGYENIVIYGGTGGRVDHTISNIQTMLYASRRGASIEMCDSTNHYFAITDGNIRINGESKGMFSVFALGGIAHNVTVKNALYCIDNFEMSPDNPRGVSNSFVGKEVTISVEKGSLLIVM